MEPSFYWHDYETFGAVPSRDRPAQFAGIRTNLNLEEIGEPFVIYNQLAPDSLPEPEACLVTGLVPQKTNPLGVCEAEFIRQIRAEFLQPSTCGVGYNSIRFDDEVTRFALYRNLYDPYEREYINQNSRWDVIDLFRLAWASRPAGINWPVDEQGVVSFRLENLTRANDIGHADAHDALADVRATIALVRRLRESQPKLFEYAFNLRKKQAVTQKIKDFGPKPFLHVSALYPAKTEGCIAPVVALGDVAGRKQDVILYNLRYDPNLFQGLSAAELRERRLTPAAHYPDDWIRPPVQHLQVNRCPLIAPVGVLSAERAHELAIDWARVEQHLETLRSHPELCQALIDSFQYPPEAPSKLSNDAAETPTPDTDQELYRGGFLSTADRQRLNQFIATSAFEWRSLEQKMATSATGDNSILLERVFRCRARNYPETLNASERTRWAKICRARLTSGRDGIPSYQEWHKNLQKKLADPNITDSQLSVLKQLLEYGQQIADQWNL